MLKTASFQVHSNSTVGIRIKDEISRWYDFCWHELGRRLLLLSVENTVQFSYQTSLLIFEYHYPNLWDIGENLHIFRMISIIRIASISMSAWSIISPIISRQTILAFIHGTESSILSTAVKCSQIFAHLFVSTITVLLLKFCILYKVDF